MHGYSGKILHIDLATRKTWAESKPEEWYQVYIGGVSMATRLCWENIEVGCDPLSPGKDRHLGAIGQMQLAQNVAHVFLDSVLADDQFGGNLAVREAVGDELEHIHLAAGQLGERTEFLVLCPMKLLDDPRRDPGV